MAKPLDGSIIPRRRSPNFREGLKRPAVLHLHPRRPQGSGGHGAEDRELRLPDAPPGRRDAGTLVVTEDDCGTSNGTNMRALVEGGGSSRNCATASSGRVAHRRRRAAPGTQGPSWAPGEMLDEWPWTAVEAAGVDEVKVRTPLTRATRASACAASATAATSAAGGSGPQRGRGGGRDRGAVDRRAGHAIDDAHLPSAVRRRARGETERGSEVRRHHINFNATMRYVTSAKGRAGG